MGKIKYIVLAAVVIVFGVFIYSKVFSTGGDPDITGIQAEFVGEVEPGGKYTRDMFDVKGITASGRLVQLKEFSVTDPSIEEETNEENKEETNESSGEGTEEKKKLRVAEHGSTCQVVVEAQGYTDTVTVTITREAESQKEIGYPEQSGAVVTYYTNGDLEFTGKGGVTNFAEDMPWKDCKYSHVYIDEALEIESMDGWFKDNEELVWCDKLPKTVKTLKHTFEGCTALKETPEYFQCADLQVMDYAFSRCEALERADVIPVNVSSMQFTFENCAALLKPANMDKTSCLSNVTGMYSGCTSLREAAPIPETVRTMDKVYMDCINIKAAVKFPDNVQSIEEAYSGCSGLETGTAIPESAAFMKKCYFGCSALAGYLEINSDTDEYDGLLQGATTNGDTLEIFGNSGNLLDIQKDSASGSINLADPVAAAQQNERMLRERKMMEGLS